MNLGQLIEPLLIYKVIGDINININNIKVDSRKIEQGDLFICLAGYSSDGHDYAIQAVANGAVALICERKLPIDVPQVIVNNSRFVMAFLSDKFYNHPSQKLKVIGITGTNGKTTTTYLIEKILTDRNHLCGLIGTIKMKIGNEIINVKNTTPDAIDLHSNFDKMIKVGSEYAIMEVSSHALDMGRVKGVDFKIAVFTNLTQDHLDYHGTMEKYREAKGLLFSQLGNVYQSTNNKFAVFNADDSASQYFNRITSVQIVTYGIDQEADVRATNIHITRQGTSFTLISFKGNIDINLKMIGKFSVYNALAAISIALIEGIALEDIKHSLEEITGVDGRFELVNANQDFTVIVDYAHTPDGLENVLKTIKEFAKRKVYCVFGAGGDRDKTKRPLMGKIAIKYSDVAIITSDNPRTENPEQIIKEIVEGIVSTGINESNYITINDRKKAIEYAIKNAESGDVVIIAGKGHETYQILNDKVIHFDDREVALEAIRSKLS